jgi:predicted permease
MSEFWRRLRFLFRGGRFDRELDEEMRAHLELQAEANREAGMDAEEARYAAARQFGNEALLREASREAWGWHWLETWARDVRYTFRTLRRNPVFTIVAVLTLALGIGINTSIFNMVDALLLRPLPFPESHRLVSLYFRDADKQVYDSLSYPDYEYLRDHNNFLSSLAAYDSATAALRFGDQVERVSGEIVSANYFSVLGVQPSLGRAFAADEDRLPGANAVVVLGYGLWQRRFGGDPGIVGKQVLINDTSFTVIGIAPRGFLGPRLDRDAPPEFWAPTMMYAGVNPGWAGLGLQTRWTMQWLGAFGRLEPGITLGQAQTAMAALTAQLKREHWDRLWGSSAAKAGLLLSANETRFNPGRRASVVNFLGLLLATTGLVLLIACSNVANLLLVQATRRTREIAVRLSLGAGRSRLVRQLLTESVVLSLLGGAVGLAVAVATSEFLAGFRQPFRMPLLLETGLNLRMLGFAWLASLFTGILFGLAPARQAMKLELTPALKSDTPSSVAGSRRWGLRSTLMVAQVALSLLLLIGAGLFVRTLQNAQAADVTRDPGNVLLFKQGITSRGYDEAQGKALYPQLLERVQGVPGVRSAALVYIVPLGGMRGGTDVVVDHPAVGKRRLQVDVNVVTPRYFQTIGIPLLHGRAFTGQDGEGAPAVAIVNEQWARRFWPGQDPVGKRFQTTWEPRTVEVVGVVRDGPFRNYRAQIKPCFYVPLAQDYRKQMSLVVRTYGDPPALLPLVRRRIEELDKDFANLEVLTLKSHRDAGLSQERLTAGLLSALGLLALALAAIGVYGVISFSAAQRTREIGLRMAMGARPADVLALVLRSGMWLAIIGVVVGLGAALGLTRFVASLVFGVSPTDPLVFAAVSLLLLGVALLACYIPARRAAKVDPLVALRYE